MIVKDNMQTIGLQTAVGNIALKGYKPTRDAFEVKRVKQAGAIVLAVRLTPRAGRDAIDGKAVLSDGREVVLARVRAVPERGGANDALIRLIADVLAVPKSAVTIDSGATARLKQVRVAGDPVILSRIVESWPAKSG